MSWEILVLFALFGIFIIVAYQMGYRAGQAKETLINFKEVPSPVDIDLFMDEDWAKEDNVEVH